MTASEVATLTAGVTILTAIVSSTTAVIVTIIAQRLARRSAEEADQRRWIREDKTRTRVRSEEMARDAIDALSQATEYVGWSGGRARATGVPEQQWVPPDRAEVAALVRPVRRAALEMDDREVREHLTKSVDVLIDADSAYMLGAPHLAQVAWAVQQASEQRIGAYLRGESWQRPDPANDDVWDLFDQGVWAVDELHAIRRDEERIRQKEEEDEAADRQEGRSGE